MNGIGRPGLLPDNASNTRASFTPLRVLACAHHKIDLPVSSLTEKLEGCAYEN
jgi:hypothetical protein